ncbi:MAG: hypothetical protein V1645_04065 [archaeon]
MLTFTNKKEVLSYIKRKFSKESNLILIRGSTAYKNVKNFSDFDIEIWGKKLRKPYYDIAFIKEKPILISAYFYKYKKGRKTKVPQGTLIIKGQYNNKIIPDFSKDKYTNKQKIKRDCQLAIDFFFKYLRTKDKKYLTSVRRRIN